MRGIIESLRETAFLGYKIAEEELQGENRVEYGAAIIKKLSKELTAESADLLSWSHYAVLLQVKDEMERSHFTEKHFITVLLPYA